MTNLSLVKGHNFNLPITLEDEQLGWFVLSDFWRGWWPYSTGSAGVSGLLDTPDTPNEEFDPDNMHFLQWKRVFQSQGRSLIGGSSYKCTKKTYVNVYASW